MVEFTGISLNNLIAIGPIKVFDKINQVPNMIKVSDVSAELIVLESAFSAANEQLAMLYDKVLTEKGKDTAEIISVQQMMLEDDEFIDAIKDMIINEKVCASYAVFVTGQTFSKQFADIENNPYMSARATDVIDISRRLIKIIKGHIDNATRVYDEKIILVADDLGPSELLHFGRDKLYALVLSKGSVNSHTSILAKTMGIPMLVRANIDLTKLEDDSTAIVDGINGKLIINPDESVLNNAKKCIDLQEEDKKSLHSLKGIKTKTKSGKEIKIHANISGVEDIASVLENDAEGIGLFRSEFLYIGKDKAPTEDEQFEAYKTVLEKMGEKPVIIRTLDIGADKMVDYIKLPSEDKLDLEFRGIRVCLKYTDIFKTQLRALFRAACYGNLKIMYPMIVSKKEIDEIEIIIKEVERELIEEGIKYKIPSQGIMIETPSAAMISESLATMVDFFSIGTNDLTQYILKVDRQNEIYNPYNDAVLSVIKMVCDNAHKMGIKVSICGELASDIKATKMLIDIGIDELSVTPMSIFKVRDVIRNLN